ncbi:DUF3857 domain-containing protein [Rubrivirga sp. IMCC45206]|uniref:DUF3857 domain-containing protein n=1 Tax=Rubrivirga sp. IMCC45206 TaxID=3391614 RepID=UPI00398FBC24
MRAVLLLAALTASASAQEWAVTPAVRLAADGAPVVVRHYATEYEVDGPGRATTRVRLVATALDAAGREAVAELGVVHGGFRRLRRFEGTLYDADGTEVRRLGRRDAEDRALGSIYEDLKVRRAALYGDRLPFTVEWTYEIEHDGVLGWPTWRPQRSGWPVEEALFTLTVPTGTPVRTLARDVVPPSERLGDRGRDARTWRIVGLTRAQIEEWGPPGWEQLPELRLGTDRFEIGGAQGRLDSWSAFGAWYDGLGADRQALPPGALAEVRRIVEGATTDAERARRLYRHLQATTRYVSIQLGLGGWQPFDAAYVFERRYGDCKALTNYMLAMLEAVGIAADPVLIEAGVEGSDLAEAFPQNAFNHVILRVPLPEYRVPTIAPDGAVWLECTSPYAAFGHLGSFTENRPGLLIDGANSRIVRTPVSTPETNWTRLDADVVVDARGSATADLRWTLHGEPRTDAVAALAEATEVDRAATLRALAGIASADLGAVDVSAVAARPDTLELSAQLAVPGLARRAGTRLLVGLTPFAGAVAVPPAVDTRRQPVRLGAAYARRDSVRIALPDGYAVDGDLPPVEVVGVVGRYALRAAADGDAIVVVRELVVDAPDQPAEAYGEVRAFFLAVAEADGMRAIARRE